MSVSYCRAVTITFLLCVWATACLALPLHPQKTPRKARLTAPPQTFIYATSGYTTDNVIYQFHAAGDGQISPLTPAALPISAYPFSLTVDASGNYLYTSSSSIAKDQRSSTATICQYRITNNGSLTPLVPASVLVGGLAYNFAVLQDAHILFTPGYASERGIWKYRIAPNGSLHEIKPFAPLQNAPVKIVLAQKRHVAYVLTRGFGPGDQGAAISEFHVTADGTFQPLKPPFLYVNPGGADLAFSADGQYAYVASDYGITYCRVRPDSGLERIAGRGLQLPDAISRILPEPTGHFFYVLSKAGGTLRYMQPQPDGSLKIISQFNVHTDGAPNQEAFSPQNKGAILQDIGFSGDKKFAYILDARGSILQYRLKEDGTLEPLSPTVVPLSGGQADALIVVTR